MRVLHARKVNRKCETCLHFDYGRVIPTLGICKLKKVVKTAHDKCGEHIPRPIPEGGA